MIQKRKRVEVSLAGGLRALREDMGASSAEVARGAGWGRPMVTVIEQGKYDMRVGTLKRYLGALNLKGHLVVAVRSEDGLETEHWVEI